MVVGGFGGGYSSENILFNMLRLAAFLQLFHFWQADKAGFMWHRKKMVCTLAASAQKCGRQTRALTDWVCKKKKSLVKDRISIMQFYWGLYGFGSSFSLIYPESVEFECQDVCKGSYYSYFQTLILMKQHISSDRHHRMKRLEDDAGKRRRSTDNVN